MLRHLIRMRSALDHARFLRQCGDAPIGVMPAQPDIPAPFQRTPTWEVYNHDGVSVTIVETTYGCFDVFEVPSTMIMPTVKGQ